MLLSCAFACAVCTAAAFRARRSRAPAALRCACLFLPTAFAAPRLPAAAAAYAAALPANAPVHSCRITCLPGSLPPAARCRAAAAAMPPFWTCWVRAYLLRPHAHHHLHPAPPHTTFWVAWAERSAFPLLPCTHAPHARATVLRVWPRWQTLQTNRRWFLLLLPARPPPVHAMPACRACLLHAAPPACRATTHCTPACHGACSTYTLRIACYACRATRAAATTTRARHEPTRMAPFMRLTRMAAVATYSRAPITTLPARRALRLRDICYVVVAPDSVLIQFGWIALPLRDGDNGRPG